MMPCRASSPRPAHVRAQAVMLRGGGTQKNQTWIPPTTPAARGHLARARGGHLTSRGGFWKQGSSCLRSEPGALQARGQAGRAPGRGGQCPPRRRQGIRLLFIPAEWCAWGPSCTCPQETSCWAWTSRASRSGGWDGWASRTGRHLGARESRMFAGTRPTGLRGFSLIPALPLLTLEDRQPAPVLAVIWWLEGRAMSSLRPATLRVSPESASSSVRWGDKAVALNEMPLQGAEGAGERSPPSRTPRDSSAPQTMPASCSPPPCLHGEMRGLGSLKPNKKGISGSGSPVSN